MRCVVLFQAEEGIRGGHVTGVQTCALPIYGNIEDLAVKTHTRNPVPLIVAEKTESFREAESILDVTPGIVELRSEERRVGRGGRTGRGGETGRQAERGSETRGVAREASPQA